MLSSRVLFKKWYALPFAIVCVIIQLFLFAMMQHLILTKIAPDDVIFVEMPRLMGYLFMLINVAFLAFIGEVIHRKFKKVKSFAPRFIFCGVVVYVLSMYIIMTSVVAVTDSHIIFYSPWHINGTYYTYGDVQKVSATIVGDFDFARLPYTAGDFRYRITMKDGNTTTFNQPAVSSLYEAYRSDDTYLELEEFDKKLVSQGVEKHGDLKNIEKVTFDKRYQERFRRIIENR